MRRRQAPQRGTCHREIALDLRHLPERGRNMIVAFFQQFVQAVLIFLALSLTSITLSGIGRVFRTQPILLRLIGWIALLALVMNVIKALI